MIFTKKSLSFLTLSLLLLIHLKQFKVVECEDQAKNNAEASKQLQSVMNGLRSLVQGIGGNGSTVADAIRKIDGSRMLEGLTEFYDKLAKDAKNKHGESTSDSKEAEGKELKKGEGQQLDPEEMQNIIEKVIKPNNIWDWIPAFFKQYIAPSWEEKLSNVLVSDLERLKPVLEDVPNYDSMADAMNSLKREVPKVHSLTNDLYGLISDKWGELEAEVKSDGDASKFVGEIKTSVLKVIDEKVKTPFQKLTPLAKSNLVDAISKVVPPLEPLLAKWKAVASENSMEDLLGDLMKQLNMNPGDLEHFKQEAAKMKDMFKMDGHHGLMGGDDEFDDDDEPEEDDDATATKSEQSPTAKIAEDAIDSDNDNDSGVQKEDL